MNWPRRPGVIWPASTCCAPIHNTIPLFMRLVFQVGWSKSVERIVRFLDRWTRVPPLPIRWHHPSGPHFGNSLALLVLDGSSAGVTMERSVRARASDGRGIGGRAEAPKLEIIADLSLTALRRVTRTGRPLPADHPASPSS